MGKSIHDCEYDLAIELWEELPLKESMKRRLRIRLTDGYERMGDVEKSLKLWQTLTQIDSNDDFSRYRLAVIYETTGNESAAVHELKQLVIRYPRRLQFVCPLTKLYQKKGEDDAAAITWKQSVAKDSENRHVQLRLAAICKTIIQTVTTR
jgi:tetratricopeptide (TPR) repeat protein